MNINELPWLDKIFNKINFNNLSHGIILNGPEGIGKSILAKEISKKLIVKEDDFKSTNLFNLNTHPDFFLLNKDKILTKHISLRDKEWDDELGNRNVIDFLSITPSISNNKVALLMNAHTMNEVSQNALLKSLEEPAPNTFIILLTNRSNSLLQTIYSRCQIINMPSLTDNEINEILELYFTILNPKIFIDMCSDDLKKFFNVDNLNLNFDYIKIPSVSNIMKNQSLKREAWVQLKLLKAKLDEF